MKAGFEGFGNEAEDDDKGGEVDEVEVVFGRGAAVVEGRVGGGVKSNGAGGAVSAGKWLITGRRCDRPQVAIPIPRPIPPMRTPQAAYFT